jgi:hypothetical protein
MKVEEVFGDKHLLVSVLSVYAQKLAIKIIIRINSIYFVNNKNRGFI